MSSKIMQKLAGLSPFYIDAECHRTPKVLALMCRLFYAPNLAFIFASIFAERGANFNFSSIFFVQSLVFVMLAHFLHDIASIKLKRDNAQEPSTPLEGSETSEVRSEIPDPKVALSRSLLRSGYILLSFSLTTFIVGAWNVCVYPVF